MSLYYAEVNSLVWLMAALFRHSAWMRRQPWQRTDGSAAVIPEATLVMQNTITGALDHIRSADRRA